MAKRKSNPNNANQYVLDPRQNICWEFYIDPNSETFGNATQSGIKAGFSKEYSNDLTSSKWFCEKLWRLNSVSKAEKVFQEILEVRHENNRGKIDAGVLRVKGDIAKFIAETQGKNVGYVKKVEADLTSKGLPLAPTIDVKNPAIMAAYNNLQEALENGEAPE
jgi:hypothetical protein